jgi:hypothetical protein
MQQHVNEIAKCIEAGNHGVYDKQIASTEEYIATSITTSIFGAERTGLAGIERSIFRESLFRLVRAYLGVLLRGLECVYFCGRYRTKIMQQRAGKYHVLILIISTFVYYPQKKKRKLAKIIPKSDELLVSKEV